METYSDSAHFTPQELAAFLRMSPKWIEKHTQARQLPGQVKMGRVWRYNKVEIQKALLTGQVLLKKGARKC